MDYLRQVVRGWTVTALTILLLAVVTHGQFFKDSPTSLMIGPPPMVHDPVRPNCENFTYGNWRVQEFYSPNYPGEYLNDTDCVLYLEAPSGFRIKLDFRDKFVLEKSNDCQYDFLEVRDGPFAYSPVIGRFCGASFPPLIRSTGRFLWMRFKTDNLLQYNGFRAVYSYVKDNTQNDGAAVSKVSPDVCRIPVKLTPQAADGVLDSSDLPFGDVSQFPKRAPVDCTWEIFTEQGNKIQLLSSTLELRNRDRCDVGHVTVFDGTTLDDDIIKQYCKPNRGKVEMTSHGNRMFVRVYGNTMSTKPNVKIVYNIVKRSVAGRCSNEEFSCDGQCIPTSLRCNHITNCRDGSDETNCDAYRPPFNPDNNRGIGGGIYCQDGEFSCDGHCVPARLRCNRVPDCKDLTDERGCSGYVSPGAALGSVGPTGHGHGSGKGNGGVQEKAEDNDDGGIPLYIIISGAVGGAILTCVTIALCVMCRLRKKDKKKREEGERTSQKASTSQQRNALEMAVCNSSNTQMSLSRQNDVDGGRWQGGTNERHQYYPGVATTPTTSMKDGSGHRFSVGGNGNGGKPMMDDGEIDILMNDNSSYNTDRYLNMAQMTSSPDDHHLMYDHHDQGHGIYPPSPMGMTSLDQRMTGDSYGVMHVNPWTGDEIGVMSTYSFGGNSSLKKPKSYLGLGKTYYNSPESKYKKALKTIENETIKEHHVT